MPGISIKYLQEYIKSKDYNPALIKDYFLKLSEEVGELARVMRKGAEKALRRIEEIRQEKANTEKNASKLVINQ